MSARRTAIAVHYEEEAKAAGVGLDTADLALIHNIEATADDIEELDKALAQDGRVVTSASGTVKVHPAVAAVKNLRVNHARLIAVMDSRIRAATGGVAGGQHGVRGVHTGTGAQNAARDADRAQRGGRGRTARPGAV